MSGGCGYRQPDAAPVLSHEQHVNGLRWFDRRGRKARELAKEVAPERNHADLFEYWQTLSAGINWEAERRNWRTREVEGIAIEIHHDLDGVEIRVLFMI